MPTARFQHRAVARTSIENAWQYLQDPETWGTLAGVEQVSDVQHDQHGNLCGYAFVARAGGRSYDGTARTIVTSRPRDMAVEIDTSEIEGVINTMLATNGDDLVDVVVTLDLTTKGWLSSMFFPLVSSAVGGGLPAHVDAFARHISDS